MQCWLSGTASAPIWFTPNFKLKWLKPNPSASLFMGTWFKLQFLVFIFPQIGAAALFWRWEYPLAVLEMSSTGSRNAPGHGREGRSDASSLFPRVLGEFLSC